MKKLFFLSFIAVASALAQATIPAGPNPPALTCDPFAANRPYIQYSATVATLWLCYQSSAGYSWDPILTNSGGAASGSASATAIQGIAVSATPPADQQVLEYSAASGAYVPTTVLNLSNGLGVSLGATGALNRVMPVRSVAAATDTIQPADCGGLVTYRSSTSVAVGLGQPGANGSFSSGCPIMLRNYGVGSVTIKPVASTIGGASSQLIVAGHFCQLVSDGTNWQLGACY